MKIPGLEGLNTKHASLQVQMILRTFWMLKDDINIFEGSERRFDNLYVITSYICQPCRVSEKFHNLNSFRRFSALHSSLQLKFVLLFFAWKSSSLSWYHIVCASAMRSFFNDIRISKQRTSDERIICSVTVWIEMSFRLFKTCLRLIRYTRVVFDGSVKERWRLLTSFENMSDWIFQLWHLFRETYIFEVPDSKIMKYLWRYLLTRERRESVS